MQQGRYDKYKYVSHASYLYLIMFVFVEFNCLLMYKIRNYEILE